MNASVLYAGKSHGRVRIWFGLFSCWQLFSGVYRLTFCFFFPLVSFLVTVLYSSTIGESVGVRLACFHSDRRLPRDISSLAYQYLSVE